VEDVVEDADREAATVLEGAVKVAGEAVSTRWQETHFAALRQMSDKAQAQRERMAQAAARAAAEVKAEETVLTRQRVTQVMVEAEEKVSALRVQLQEELRVAAEAQMVAVEKAEAEAESDESIQRIIGELVDKDVAAEVSVAVGLRRQRCKAKMHATWTERQIALERDVNEAKEGVQETYRLQTAELLATAVAAVEERVAKEMEAEAEALQAKAVREAEAAAEGRVTGELRQQFDAELTELQQQAQALRRTAELRDQMLAAVISDEVERARAL